MEYFLRGKGRPSVITIITPNLLHLVPMFCNSCSNSCPRRKFKTFPCDLNISWNFRVYSGKNQGKLREFHFHEKLGTLIFGPPGPCLPATSRSRAVLAGPAERITCPYHRGLPSLMTCSRSMIPSFMSRASVRTLATSLAWMLHIHLIMALSFLWSRSRLVFFIGQVSLACSIALLT